MGAARRGPSQDATRGFAAGFVAATVLVLVAGRLGVFSSSALGDGGAQLSLSALQTVQRGATVGSSAKADDCAVHNIRIKNPAGNPLWELFQQHTRGPLMRKWSQYFDVYHRYFEQFRGKKLNFLEIGVQSGGTIEMWHSYFGGGLTMYGIDINVYCRELFNDPPRTNIFVGDQSDRKGWAKFRKEMAKRGVTFDVILDDGGHTMEQQITTWEEAWPMLKDGGVYICEDTATSMDVGPNWGGGYKKDGTWLEYAKNFADFMNGHYVKREAHPRFDPLNRTAEIVGTGFYDQMVVLEKGPHPKPDSVKAGIFSIPIVAQLKDGQVDQRLLKKFQKQLAESLQDPTETAA